MAFNIEAEIKNQSLDHVKLLCRDSLMFGVNGANDLNFL